MFATKESRFDRTFQTHYDALNARSMVTTKVLAHTHLFVLNVANRLTENLRVLLQQRVLTVVVNILPTHRVVQDGRKRNTYAELR
jgi:hypothetical protein